MSPMTLRRCSTLKVAWSWVLFAPDEDHCHETVPGELARVRRVEDRLGQDDLIPDCGMAQVPDVHERGCAAPRLQPDRGGGGDRRPRGAGDGDPAPVSTTAADAAAAMAPLPMLRLMCSMLVPSRPGACRIPRPRPGNRQMMAWFQARRPLPPQSGTIPP